MVAVLKFDLETEKDLYDTYIKAPEYQDCVNAIYQKLRAHEKYGEKLNLKQFIEFLRKDTKFYELAD